MIEVPASILSALDRIALKGELLQEAVIKKLDGKLPEVFEAIILSGDETGTNNKNEGTAYGNPKSNNPQAQSYFFTRVRRMDIDENEKPSPFLAKTRELARKLVNMHPIGVLLNTPAITQHPRMGDTWSCRYLTEDRKGIVLINRTGVSKQFLTLQSKDSMFQAVAANWKGETLAQYYPVAGAAKSTGTAQLTGLIENAWTWLSPLLPEGARMTSGLRTQASQDAIIKKYAIREGIDHADLTSAHKKLKEKGYVIARRVTTKPGHGHGGGGAFDVSGADLDMIKRAVETASVDPEIKVTFRPFGTGAAYSSIVERKNNAVHVEVESSEAATTEVVAAALAKYSGGI